MFAAKDKNRVIGYMSLDVEAETFDYESDNTIIFVAHM